MAVLLTGADHALGKAVLGGLERAGCHHGQGGVRTTASSVFLPDESTDQLVEGIETLVHLTSYGCGSSGSTRHRLATLS